MSWTIGGEDEPLDCRLRIESYLQNLPKRVPEEVIQASRFFLSSMGNGQYEEELKRVLIDDSMGRFWHTLRLKFNRNPYIPTGQAIVEHNWQGLISRCIRLMMWKGGKLPDMSKTEFHNARKGSKNSKNSGVAGEIRRLINKLNKPESTYQNIAKLSVFDLVRICSESETKGISIHSQGSLSELKKADNTFAHRSLTLIEILVALQEKIDKKECLSLRDELIPVKNIPQLNRPNAQQAYFRENFLDCLYEGTLQNCWELAATAENIIFNLPEYKRVTGVDLREQAKK